MSNPNPNKIIHVEIVDAVGDGGTFYGDHVVIGDPFNDPPDNWEYGQLLFDGYDEDPTDGTVGGGGPHDHDYLPLTGGTLTGDLQVDGRIQAFTGVSPDDPAIKFDAGTGMYRKGVHQIGFAINGVMTAYIDSGGVHGQIAFNVAADIDTADVLDRAETATMPAVDDEGVATADAEVDSLTVNEVVTAMLAKIKELSSEIDELKKQA